MDDDHRGPARAALDRRLDRLWHAAEALREVGLEQRAGEIERRVAGLRWRLRVSVDAALVAIAGGTGVGKSSLLNAIAGREISPAGVRRPTTTRPVAWVPADAPDELAELLRDLGITDQVPQERLHRVAVVDLPDIDSEERAHRATATAVISRSDLVVWVVDPEKYADAALHTDLLEDEGDRPALFVLNKIDRLAPEEAEAVTADLRLRLRERPGGEGWDILPVAADPPTDPPEGILRTVDVLQARVRETAVRTQERVREEAESVAASMATILGGDPGEPGSLVARYDSARAEAGAHIRDAVIRAEGATDTVRAWQRTALRVTTPSVARRDPVASLLRDDPGTGPQVDEAGVVLSEMVTDLARRPVAAPLRGRLGPDELRDTVARAATEARTAAAAVMTAPVPEWWSVAGWTHAGAVVAAVVSLLWAAAGMGGRPQGTGAPIIALGLSVLVALGLTGALVVAGRREGARRTRRAVSEIDAAARAVLDREVGDEVARVEDAAEAVRAALGDAREQSTAP